MELLRKMLLHDSTDVSDKSDTNGSIRVKNNEIINRLPIYKYNVVRSGGDDLYAIYLDHESISPERNYYCTAAVHHYARAESTTGGELKKKKRLKKPMRKTRWLSDELLFEDIPRPRFRLPAVLYILRIYTYLQCLYP